MKFEPAAFLVGTSDLSAEERGIYITLLCQQWERGGYLPTDHGRLARLCGVTEDDFESAWKFVGTKFEETERGYCNLRCLETFEAAEERMEIWRESGRKGGLASKGASKGALREASREPQPYASYSSSSSNSSSREGGDGGSVRGVTVSASLEYLPDDHSISNARGRNVEVPESLSSSESWRDAFAEWCAFRREIGKTLTPTSIRKQLKLMANLGPADAVHSMEQSMRHGWAGLFEPKGGGVAKSGTPGRHSADYIESKLSEEDDWTIAEGT